MSLRERRRRETAQYIQEALVALLNEKDFASITAEEISQRADISLRTFFNYYPNKEAALLGPTNHIAEWMSQLVSERRGPLVEDLFRMHCEIGASLVPHRAFLGLVHRLEQEHPRVAQLRALSMAESRQELTRALQGQMPGVSPMTCAICAQALIEAGTAGINRWIAGEAELEEALRDGWAALQEMTEILSGRRDPSAG